MLFAVYIFLLNRFLLFFLQLLSLIWQWAVMTTICPSTQQKRDSDNIMTSSRNHRTHAPPGIFFLTCGIFSNHHVDVKKAAGTIYDEYSIIIVIIIVLFLVVDCTFLIAYEDLKSKHYALVKAGLWAYLEL